VVTADAQVDLSLVLSRAKESNDESYAQMVCQFPFSFYLERVRAIDFVGKDSVLDVGCGFGQWTVAHALLNRRVVALEYNRPRLAIARDLVRKSGLENVNCVLGNGLTLPFAEASFDAIFCYGVFMFLHRQQAVQEFRRVLRPGGDLYVCTNASGWWLRLWLQHLMGDAKVRTAAFQALTRGRRGSLPNSTSRKDVSAILKSNDWQQVEAGYEGTICRAPGKGKVLSCYPGSFWGLDAVIEFLARKTDSSRTHRVTAKLHNESKALDVLQEVVRRTIARACYEYVSPLRELPQPRPAVDLVNNCCADVVREAVRLSLSLDRVQQLQWIYQQVTRDSNSPLDRIRACVRFAQSHFFHHFAGQPMQAPHRPLYDPIAAVLVRFGRCGTMARFLVDLFECNGMPARLLIAGCHVSAEVLSEGQWLLADANLFPPGICPLDETGGPLRTERVLEEPGLLDGCPSYINYHHEYVEAFLREYPETATAIERYLRSPLLPSSGYFGEEYFVGRTPGSIERLSKFGTPTRWNSDVNFGWEAGFERQALPARGLPSRQRPGQVTAVFFRRGELCWEPPVVADDSLHLRYHLTVNDRPRGWAYDGLPIGCGFSVEGSSIRTDVPRVSTASLASHGRYITIVAEVKEWEQHKIFYLPSKEFDLADGCRS
jgi:SAM-dependent methyltransferase